MRGREGYANTELSFFSPATVCYVMVRMRDRCCETVVRTTVKLFAQTKYYQYLFLYFLLNKLYFLKMAQYWKTLPKLGHISANIGHTLIIASLVLFLHWKKYSGHIFIILKTKQRNKQKTNKQNNKQKNKNKRLRNTIVKLTELFIITDE